MECLPSYVDDLYLQHHGIKGMHWGVRKYENYDGTLTPAGRKRYAKLASKYDKKSSKSLKKAAVKGAVGTAAVLATRKNPYLYKATPYIAGVTAASAGASAARGAYRKSKQKKYMKAVASNRSPRTGLVSKGLKAAAGAALVGGAAYALHKSGKDRDILNAVTKRVQKLSMSNDIVKPESSHRASDAIKAANAKASKIRTDASSRVSSDIKAANAKASRARAAAAKQQAAEDIFAQQVSTIKNGVSSYLNTDNLKKTANNIGSAAKQRSESRKEAKTQARKEERKSRGRHADNLDEKFERAKKVYGTAKKIKASGIPSMIANMNSSTIDSTSNLLNQFGISM